MLQVTPSQKSSRQISRKKIPIVQTEKSLGRNDSRGGVVLLNKMEIGVAPTCSCLDLSGTIQRPRVRWGEDEPMVIDSEDLEKQKLS